MISRIFLIFLFNLLVSIIFSEAVSKCIFPSYKNLPESIDFLNKLGNQTYEAKDDSGTYLYKIGFCQTPQTEATDTGMAAVLQQHIADKKWVVIGRYNDTDLKTGNNWGLVEFGSGNRYDNHCLTAHRVALIMITCNSDIEQPVLRVIEENNIKLNNCYYLFEIEHPNACKATAAAASNKSIGAGAIFTIILVSAVVLYLCGGVAFKKVLYNTEGVELIPNINFWRRIGTLCADGADCICRPNPAGPPYQRYTSSSSGRTRNTNNLTINDLDPADDDDDEILTLP